MCCVRGKLAGILAESSSSSAGLAHPVVGIGINVNACRGISRRAALSRGVVPHAHGPGLGSGADLAADVLGTIEAYYDCLLRDLFARLRGAYEARLVHMEREVAFEQTACAPRVWCGASPAMVRCVSPADGTERLPLRRINRGSA